MDGTFMDFWKSKARDSLRLLLNVSCEINLNRKDKYVVLSKLSIYYTWKIKKCHTKIVDFEYQLQHMMKNLNYPMVHSLYQTSKITLNIS